MKRHGILNSDISRVLSYMGHTDCICIGDCGLPIPDETERIDLAVKFGVPTFMDVLKEVGNDMKIEKIVLAEEIKEYNPQILAEIKEYFAGQEVEVEYVSHFVLLTSGHIFLQEEQACSIHRNLPYAAYSNSSSLLH